MEVRSIIKSDLEKIIDLIKQGEPYVLPYNLYAYWILQNYYSSTCKVVECENSIIGYISAMPSLDINTVFIWQVCVDRNYRKSGVGTILLDSIVNKSKRLGYNNIQFSISASNFPSQSLFKKYAEQKDMKIFEKCIEHFGDTIEKVFEIKVK